MLTVSIQLVDYNRSPSVVWLRVSRFTRELPRKGERIEHMPAFSVRRQPDGLLMLQEGERVTYSGNVNQLTWRGESEVIIEVFGTYTREGAHGPVSP